MPNEFERRSVLSDVELRDDEQGARLVGYAALYDSESVPLQGFTEILKRGCFDDCLADPKTDCIACFNHDPSMIMGRQSAGTLKLFADEKGLRYEVYPVPESRRDVIEAIRLRNVVGSSFAFTVNPDGEHYERDDKGARRIVTRCSGLFDVCPVVSPAYPETTTAVRQRAAEWLQAKDEKRCPCGSGRPYKSCCGRYGKNKQSPFDYRAKTTAEWLRRVR